jgi:soluble lytic murein transglycosylase-like protein
MKRLALCLVVFFAALTPFSVSTASYSPLPEWEAPGLLVEYIADKFDLPHWEVKKIVRYAYALGDHTKFPTPLDVLALIGVESRFKTNARGPGGAGLMQINPSVWKDVDFYNPYESMVKGVKILSEYRSKVKTDHRALVYYNQGPAGSAGISKSPYSVRVMALKQELNREVLRRKTCSLS